MSLWSSVRDLFNRSASSGSGVTPPIPPIPTLEIDTHGLDIQLNASVVAMGKMAAAFSNFRIPLEASVKRVIIPSVEHNFDVEGRPPWASLAESTITNRGGSAHPILNDTGRLRSVATSFNSWNITKDTAQLQDINGLVPYAGYNQGGTRKMPARPFIMIQDDDIEEMNIIFTAWMDTVAREIGGFK